MSTSRQNQGVRKSAVSPPLGKTAGKGGSKGDAPAPCRVQAAGAPIAASDYSALIKVIEKMERNLEEVLVTEMRRQFDAQNSRIDSLRKEYAAGKKVIEEISTAIDGMTNTIDTTIVKSDSLCKLVDLYYAQGGFAMGEGKDLLAELIAYIEETNPGQVISDKDLNYLGRNFPGSLRKMRMPLGRALQRVVGEDFHDQEQNAKEYIDGLAEDKKTCKELVLLAMKQAGASTYKDEDVSEDTRVHQKPCVRFWVRALMKAATVISMTGLDEMRKKLSEAYLKKNNNTTKKPDEVEEANFFKYVLYQDQWGGKKPTQVAIAVSGLPGMTAVGQTQFAAALKRRRDWEAKRALKRETQAEDDADGFSEEDPVNAATTKRTTKRKGPNKDNTQAAKKGAIPTSPVSDLRSKATAFREQARKGDPLPDLLAGKTKATKRPAACEAEAPKGRDDCDFSGSEEDEKTEGAMFLGKVVGSSKLRAVGKQRYVEEPKEPRKKAARAKGASQGQKRTKKKRESDATDDDDDDEDNNNKVPLLKRGAKTHHQKAEDKLKDDETEEEDYAIKCQRNRAENAGDDGDENTKPPATKKTRKSSGNSDSDEDAKPRAKKIRKSGGDSDDGDEDAKTQAKKKKKNSKSGGDSDDDEDARPPAKKKSSKSGGDSDDDEDAKTQAKKKKSSKSGGDSDNDEDAKPRAKKKSRKSGGDSDGDEDAKPPATKKPEKQGKRNDHQEADSSEAAKPTQAKPSKERQAEPVTEWKVSQRKGTIRPNQWERMEAQLTRTDDHLVRRVYGLPEWALENDQLATKISIALVADRHEWTNDGLLLTYQDDRKLLKHDKLVFYIGAKRAAAVEEEV